MSQFQEKHPLNPFTNRGAITNPDEFFGRERQIGEIVEEIVENDQNGYRLSIEMFRLWILRNQTAALASIGDADLKTNPGLAQ